ncbi:MAG: TolB family protein [Thermoanaerobaculia bacterium]
MIARLLSRPLALAAVVLWTAGPAAGPILSELQDPAGSEEETAQLETAEDEAPPPPAPIGTDIYLIDFDTETPLWTVTGVSRITDRDAYDNQPYFEANGESLLYTAAQENQTEIFRHVIADGSADRLTETAESEFSPTPVPGWPGFSTVRVEADGTQRLWRFCSSGGCSPELLFEEIQPVGYHAWIDPDTVAMFVLGEPHELVVADLLTQEARTVARDIGRALHRVPGRDAVSLVDKSGGEIWKVSILDLESGEVSGLIQTPPESEDFTWWSDREILIGHGSKLYLFHLDESDEWREVVDLSGHGIGGITRLSPSPHGARLALVAERPAPAASQPAE